MKRILHITSIYILTLVMLFQGLYHAVTLFHFYVNQNYIAKNLCENRDKPMLKCKGHCQLRKNFEKNEQSSSRQTPKDIKVDILLFIDDCQSIVSSKTVIVSNPKYIPKEEGIVKDFLSEILRPPTTEIA